MLRLNPALPMVWRSPTELQFGVHPAKAIIQNPSFADESALVFLQSGVTRETLTNMHRASGGSEGHCDQLLARLKDVLIVENNSSEFEDDARVGFTDPEAQMAEPIFKVFLDVDDSTYELHLRKMLKMLGYRPENDVREADFAVIARRWVISPERYHYLLSADIAHLGVTFSSTGAIVGPLVVPGEGACLHCVHLHHCDDDPAWPSIAAQLAGAPLSEKFERVMVEAASMSLSIVDNFLRLGTAPTAGLRMLVEPPSTNALPPMTSHPECGCQAPPETLIPSGLGSSSSSGFSSRG